MPAITAQQRSDLVLLVNGVFGAAPTSRVLSNLVKLVEEGNSVDQVATMLTNNSNFESIYAPALLNSEFATQFTANLLGAAATTETTARVEALVTSYLSAGDTRTEAVWKVTKLLSETEDAAFATAKAQLNNKADVSLTFALDTSYTELMTLAQLQSVIANVTSDAATVTAAKTAIAEGTAVSGVSTGETFTLTTGVDQGTSFTGTAKNDVFNADYASQVQNPVHTLGALDILDGGAGTDTLNITSDNGTTPFTLSAATVSNIETISIQGSDDVTANTSGSTFTGVETLKSTKSVDSTLTAAATTDISVSGATGTITVNGGKDVVVTDSAANNSISVGDTTESAGTVTVTDTNQGTGNIVVEGGTDVTVSATVSGTTADVSGGTINVGNNTDQPTGAINVTQTNTNTGDLITAGSAGVLAIDIAGLVLDDTDTLTFSGAAGTIYTASADNTSAATVAAALNNTTVTVNSIVYDVTASGTVITFTAQTNSSENLTLPANFGSLSGVDNATAASNFAQITSNTPTTDSDGTADNYADVTAGAINVQGGTSINITVDSTSSASSATADGDITNGVVTATAGNTTESISVVQNNTATTQTQAATSLVGGTQTVTFKALASGQSVTVAGLTFTAAKALTAAEVASAFADLTAVDTQSNGTTAQGIYTNDVDANITSGSANGAVVVFTNTAGTAAPTLNLASSAGATSLPTAVAATGTAATAEDKSSNTVTAGNVVLNDNTTASVKTITVDTFGTATLGTTNGFDVLETLSLTNSNGATTLDTAATTLTVNLDNVDHTVNLDSGAATIETLTINTSGTASTGAITAAAATTVTINAEAALSGASTFTAATLIDVNGSASVDLTGATTNAATLETIDASGNTGGVTAVLGGTNAVAFTGGTGNDSLTLGAAAIASGDNIDLGAGDDTLVLAAGTNASTINATVTGGEGTDTLSVGYADAVAVSGNSDFDAEVANFERLTINDAANDNDSAADTFTVNLANLTYDYVTVNGTGDADDADVLALTGASAAFTLNFAGSVSGGNNTYTVALADSTGSSDSVTYALSSTGVNGSATATNNVAGTAVAAGTVTADSVETFNISSTAADPDGAQNSITANGDAVTTITLTGDAGVALTSTNTTTLKTVDASALTGTGSNGAFTFTLNSASMTVTGGAGNDTITTTNASDSATLNGGAGDDTFVIVNDADLVTINGGAGNDTFDFNGASSNKSNYVVISGVDSGDTIDLAGVFDMTDFNATAITLAQGATESTQAYLDQAIATLAQGETGWFQYNGNTYVVADVSGNANSFVDGTDFVTMITGTVDLSTASFNATSDTLEIA